MKTGDYVRISENLKSSKTERDHSLDGTGYMLKMQGEVFPIQEVSMSGNVYIHNFEAAQNFVFSPEDVTIVSKEEIEVELPEQIFSFDEQNLSF